MKSKEQKRREALARHERFVESLKRHGHAPSIGMLCAMENLRKKLGINPK